MTKIRTTTTTWIAWVVVGAAAVWGCGEGFVADNEQLTHEQAAQRPQAVEAPEEGAPAVKDAPAVPGAERTCPAVSTIEGTVLAFDHVSRYTYLLLETGASQRWAAVKRTEVTLGERVTLVHAFPVEGFRSPTSGRVYDALWMGHLVRPSAGDAPASGGTCSPGTSGERSLSI